MQLCARIHVRKQIYKFNTLRSIQIPWSYSICIFISRSQSFVLKLFKILLVFRHSFGNMSLYDRLHRTQESSVTLSLNQVKVDSALQIRISPLTHNQKHATPQPANINTNLMANQNPSYMSLRFNTLNPQQDHSQLKRQRSPSHVQNIYKQYEARNSRKMQEEHVPIKGTNNQIFKPFLRITHVQTEDDIRNQQTLAKAFAELQRMINQEDIDYKETMDQLKSIRQDLHVQHINNEFALKVLRYSLDYALRNQDLVEFSKCLGQIKIVCDIRKEPIDPLYISLEMIFLLTHSLFMEYQSLLENIDPRYLETQEVQRAIQLYKLIVTKNFAKIHRQYMPASLDKASHKHMGAREYVTMHNSRGKAQESDLVKLLLLNVRHKINHQQVKVMKDSNRGTESIQIILRKSLYKAKQHQIQRFLRE